MPSPWNEGTDRQLLLLIIELSSPTLPKWDQVAQHMGDGFTTESVRQHFQKLRKETKAKYGDMSAAKTSTPTPPKKRKGTATPVSKKRKVQDVSDAEDVDEEGDRVINGEGEGEDQKGNPFT